MIIEGSKLRTQHRSAALGRRSRGGHYFETVPVELTGHLTKHFESRRYRNEHERWHGSNLPTIFRCSFAYLVFNVGAPEPNRKVGWAHAKRASHRCVFHRGISYGRGSQGRGSHRRTCHERASPIGVALIGIYLMSVHVTSVHPLAYIS